MKQPKEVGTEFATVINNNQPYGGFYKSEAQPVTPTATPRSANMSDVARFAKANNMSIDDAVTKLEADGVDVVGN
jgi:hypothetical protein